MAVRTCKRRLNNANFSKRLEAATTEFLYCQFKIHIVLFRLNAFVVFSVV